MKKLDYKAAEGHEDHTKWNTKGNHKPERKNHADIDGAQLANPRENW